MGEVSLPLGRSFTLIWIQRNTQRGQILRVLKRLPLDMGTKVVVSTLLFMSNLDSRALLRMTARERRALGNPETGVFLIGFREEQRARK